MNNQNQPHELCIELYGGPLDGQVMTVPSDWQKMYVPFCGKRHVYHLCGYPEQFRYSGLANDDDGPPENNGGTTVKANPTGPAPSSPMAKLLPKDEWANIVYGNRVQAILLFMHEESKAGNVIDPAVVEELHELEGFCPGIE